MKKITGILLTALALLALSGCNTNKEGYSLKVDMEKMVYSREKEGSSADSSAALWEKLGLEGETADELLAACQAAPLAGQLVVEKNLHIAAGKDLLESFYESSRRGEPGSLLLLHYYSLENQRLGVELFEEEYSDYPKAFLALLEYDGKEYRHRVRESKSRELEEGADVRFPYLIHDTEEPTHNPRYGKAEHYALTTDESVRWGQIMHSMLSSDFHDQIRFSVIASDYFTVPPVGSYIPGEKEKQIWLPLEGYESPDYSFAMVNMEQTGERFPGEAARGAVNLIACRQGERILWRLALPFAIGQSRPLGDGILVSGREDVVYLTPEGQVWHAQKQTHADIRRVLLGAERRGENTVLAFRYIDIEGIEWAELWTVDPEGQILNAHEVALGEGIVRAACVSKDGAYYVLQDAHLSDTARIIIVDEQRVEAQDLPLNIPQALKGRSLVVRDIYQSPEDPRRIYLSAYCCNTSPRPVLGRWDEVDEIMEYGFRNLNSEDGAFASSPEFTQMVQAHYTAELYVYEIPDRSSDTHPFAKGRVLKTWPGALGGLLYTNQEGDIAWEIEEIGEAIYSGATSSFNLMAPCRVIQFFYNPSMEEGADLLGFKPGGFRLTEKTVYFRR